MDWVVILRLLFVLLGVLLLLFFGFLAWRRHQLASGHGAFECYQRKAGLPEKARWHHGIVRYRNDAVVWFPLLSFGVRPVSVIPRLRIRIAPRRQPTVVESVQLFEGQAIVGIAAGGTTAPVYEWAMTDSAANGLLAWAEAAPPGEGQYGHTSAPTSAKVVSTKAVKRAKETSIL